MYRKRERRNSSQIDSSSMADIAFLLLIFFLVSTTIKEDEGILVKLPPITEDYSITEIINRNLFRIHVNEFDELLVRDEPLEISGLKPYLKEFIQNPQRREDYARSPNKAVVSLMNHKKSSYQFYIEVYNEIKSAYNELRDEYSNSKFGTSYQYANKHQREEARKAIPFIVSEADPFG